MIPIAKPLLGSEEKNRIIEAMDTGILAQGQYVAEFEKAFADYVGTRHAVATSNGTTALFLALKALGIGPGDEVITTPFTFIATASTITMCGARPVFADIDRETYNIDPLGIKDALSPKTKAIVPVHLYGLPANMDEIMAIAEEHGLYVLEDACQAHGALYNGRKVGSIGHAAAFSFYPTKNMTTGEGGMITTNDAELAERLRMLRNHGQSDRYEYAFIGYNMRMTNLQAAIGIEQLKKLDNFNKARRANARALSDELNGLVKVPEEYENATHVYHQYTIALKDRRERDAVMGALKRNHIGYGVYYPKPLYAYQPFANTKTSAPNTEWACERVLSLPVHPGIDENDIGSIVQAVKDALKT